MLKPLIVGSVTIAVAASTIAQPKVPDDPRAEIRFTTNRGALDELFLTSPAGPATFTALAATTNGTQVERATLLGGGSVAFRQDAARLHLDMGGQASAGIVPAVRLEGRGLA